MNKKESINFRKNLAKFVGYPLQDFIKNTSPLKEKQFLLNSQNWGTDQLTKYKLEKLIQLVDFSYRYVPYYNKLFRSIGLIPSDIKKIDDLKNIPILTKDVALRENLNLYSNYNFSNLKTGKTGGTSGTPLVVKSTIETRSIVWGAYYRWYKWLDIEVGDPIVTMWGATTVVNHSFLTNLKERIIYSLQNNLRMNSFEMNDKTLPKFINNIQHRQPKMIKGYLSAMLQLAQYIETHSIEGIKPSVISSTSETLYPHFRFYLQKIFNAEIFDQYGCGECQSVAYECRAHEGMHITEEHVLVEVIDESGNDITDQSGRIILTDLDNLAMPFIRYENGDTGVLSSSYCSCGIKHRLLREISGRTADTIVLKNGSKVHGVFFTDIVFEIDPEESRKIRRFQAFQENAGEIEFRIEKTEELNPDFLLKIDQALKKDFKSSRIVFMDKIPFENSGKFKYVKSIIR